ncbi:MAG: hypothetical protein KC729_14495, partial [Candidatus Eisenbacteria bacterium]|nr:hypothetical protein [Candidatus Eisenbacteria bacterium]
LGLIYEQNGRFAGGAYSPLLRKVDRFDTQSLRKSLSQREGLAARLLQIDVQVTKLIESLRERGLTSPYLRNYVVARLNPVRFVRTSKDRNEPPMTLAAALTKMTAAARAFDVNKVKPGDLALVAAVVSGDDD